MQSRLVHSLLLTLALLLGCAVQVKGQGESSLYYDDKSYTLVHAAGHWYDTNWRGEYTQGDHTNDTFEGTESMILAPDKTTKIQNTHVFVDTIYMEKGQTAKLYLPILHKNTEGSTSAGAYIRWYNYRTGKTFSYTSSSTNDHDLLYPMNRGTKITTTQYWGYTQTDTTYYNYMYRDVNNGYFGGQLLGLGISEDFGRFYFYYPTDDEATSWGFNSTSNDNDDYIVACDISPYQDGDLTDGTLTEPALSQRVIFYISGMSNSESELQKVDENDDRFWQYIRDCHATDATTGKSNNDLDVDDPAKKYYVTYDIDFPFTRFDTSASYEMVVLNKSVDHYFSPSATTGTLHVTLKDGTGDKESGIKLIYQASDSSDPQEVEEYDKSSTRTSISPRCIRFSYPTTNSDNTQEVLHEDATATIYVTNSAGDGLARFNLTFTKGMRLLTQSEIATLETGHSAGGYNGADSIQYSIYKNRTPSYLKDNYELITNFDMNYNPAAESISGVVSSRNNNGQSMNGSWSRTGIGVYPFPMGWSFSSYGIHDGSCTWEGHSNSATEGSYVPQWGQYGFVNKYIWDNLTNNTSQPIATTLPNGDVMKQKWLDGSSNNYYAENNYFMFVDAAADPGIIARLPFRGNLCAGSELFMTGWVKNGLSTGGESQVDAAILMSVVAARVDADGNEIDTRVMSRHSTGQFPRTAQCLRYGAQIYSGTTYRGDLSGKEEWLQFFYTFVMPQEPFGDLGTGESVKYYLELQNNAESSAGADYYLDDICIYMANPTVTVTQVTPTCSSTDTRMQIKLDYDMTVSRFGLQDQATFDKASRVDVNFVIIDSENYATKEKAINDRTDITDTEKNDLRAEAFKSCRVKFGFLKDVDNGDGTTTTKAETLEQRQTMVFYNSYLYMQGHTDGTSTGEVDETVKSYYYYDDTKRGYNTAYTPASTTENPNPYPRWRILTEGDKRYLVTDISVGDGNSETAIQAGRVYTLVMASSYDASSSSESGTAADQVSVYNAYVDPCGYQRSFTPQGSLILQTTGQIVTPDMSFCTGQINNFTAKLRIYKNGEQLDIVDGYFDWFFDDEEVYNASNDEFGGVSLKDALYQLRQIYPDLTLTQLDTLKPITKADNALTQDMIDIIKYYTQQESEEFLNPMLVLHEQAANMRISLADGEIVVYPSPITLTDADAMACFDPIAITFTVTGTAPEIHLGYEADNAHYSKSVQAGLRMSLEKLMSHDSSSNPISLPIRGVRLGNTGSSNVHHLGIVEPTTEGDETKGSDLRQIYLVSTDDPFYAIKQNGQYSNPIGKLDELYADSIDTKDNKLKFHFDTTEFKPREGFTYNVKIWFGEKDASSNPISTITESTSTECYGSIVIPIRVVPKYLKWTGSATDNWNNDDHWKRSLGSEIYKNSNTYTDSEHYDGDYLDYRYDTLKTISTNYYCKGFVPLDCSYVTIPESAQVQLYQVAKKEGSNNILDLSTTKPTDILSATKNIEYDLVYDEDGTKSTVSGSTVTYHTNYYYTNKVHDVHFRPAAEMLHAEYLDYQKAWVDMKLPTAEWSLVSTPFEKTYSGEFYTTPTNGLQQTELFLPITFTGAGVTYDRFAPAVYLRSYVGASALRLESSSDTKGTSMAMTGRWSGVYNKVNRALAIGQAFSVKPVKGNADAVGDSVIIRLPKADDTYDYYYDDSSTGSNNTEVSKDEENGTNRYSLVAYDGILPENATTAQTFTATLTDEIEPLPTDGTTTDQWYILGNPFVSQLNLSKFLAANTAFDAKTYMTAEGVAAAVEDATLIPPLSAFFAKLADGATKPATLTYSADMEALRVTETTTSGVRGLRLTAAVDGHATHAYIVTDAAATAGYQAGEDYEVFVPDADDLACPVVYTVAGNVATTVNRTASLSNIPIGLIGGENDDEVSVRFDFEGLGEAAALSSQSKESGQSTVSNVSTESTGTGEFGETTLSLYDAVLSTTTPLEPGSVVKLQAGAHGRYFLNLGAAPVAETNITIYSANRELVVSSTADPLTRVEVYTPDGRRVLTATPSATTFTTQLPTGIYIVRAATADQQARGKVRL